METTILRLENISKKFGGLWAVRDVSISVSEGERRVIIGPNGAGKTTLFNVIAGDLAPNSGKVYFLGRDITKLPVHKRVRLGLRRTYQSSAILENLTVRDNLCLAIAGYTGRHFSLKDPYSDRARNKKVEETAAIVGLEGKLSEVAGSLSHGEKRQLELGLAIAWSPVMLMLDEPCAGLSPEERNTLRNLLVALPKNITLLLIEHDMDIALSVGEFITVMHEGQVIAEGTPLEISSNKLVQRVYMGEQ